MTETRLWKSLARTLRKHKHEASAALIETALDYRKASERDYVVEALCAIALSDLTGRTPGDEGGPDRRACTSSRLIGWE